MSDFVPKSSSEALRALGGLSAVVADPDQRKEFSVDARATLERAGVDLEQLPEGLVERLGSLGYDELTVLAKHAAELRKHGFYGEFPDGVRLEFF